MGMRNYEKEEWFHRVRDRYIRADRCGKKQLLDEITDLHGMHRKTAIRLLKKRHKGRSPGAKRRGPKSRYDNPKFLEALRLVLGWWFLVGATLIFSLFSIL